MISLEFKNLTLKLREQRAKIIKTIQKEQKSGVGVSEGRE